MIGVSLLPLSAIQILEQVQHEIDALDQDSNLPARPIEPGR